jgi:hypothetical protein
MGRWEKIRCGFKALGRATNLTIGGGLPPLGIVFDLDKARKIYTTCAEAKAESDVACTSANAPH